MPLHEPWGPNERFAAAFNTGDMEGMLAAYEPEATMLTTGGQRLVGRESIRSALLPVAGPEWTIAVSTHTVLEAAELALLRSDWTIRGTAAGGAPITRTGHTVGVSRRQADGSWLLALENSYDD